MINTKTTRSAAAIVACLAVFPAMAHHSGSMFDSAKPMTLRGVVRTFDWVNPHARILIEPDDQTGKIWMLETTSPGRLARGGWTRRSLQPGDRVEVKMLPAKDGRLMGNLVEIRNLATGVALDRPD